MRPIITDDDYLKSILRDGAGHRVGIQNLPAGGPTPDLPIYREELGRLPLVVHQNAES